MTATRLLIVDDDPELRQLLNTYFSRQGYDVLVLPDTAGLDRHLARFSPGLLILDWMLPGEDGPSACRRLRARGEQTPIIMLTGRDEPVDRVIGLQMGADDYIGKPFDPRELLARVEAVLRRPPVMAQFGIQAGIRFGDCELDPNTRTLRRQGKPVELSGGEYDLLFALVRHPNRTLSREKLLSLIAGEDGEQMERAIDVRIHRLRRAIEPDPARPVIIKTVWGLGYVFAMPASEAGA